jgi:xylulokinase
VHESLYQALKPIDRAAIAGCAVSGQQHGLVALDTNCEPLRPAKLWCDVEASEQAEKLSSAFGWQMPPAFTAAKVQWLQEQEPEEYRQMKHVLLPHDYINYFLTGNLFMEVR